MKVVLVSGPTDYVEYSRVEAALDDLEPGDLVVHGKAKGLDTLAASVAALKRAPSVEVPYIGWLRGAGGPARNKIMVDVACSLGEAHADWRVECRAFGTGDDPGTADCAKQAIAAGIPVHWYA